MSTEAPAGVNEARAQELRDCLVSQLSATGDLKSHGWRDAVRRVPRHVFLPRFYAWKDTDGGPTAWVPVSRESAGEDAWLTQVYENTTWTTQLDGSDASWEHDGPQLGSPTSSSTLPGLLVRMLERLDVADGDQLLIVGTGTGYSTALASERLGAGHVVSVDVDPVLADRARARLHHAGYPATVVAGDGLAGYEPRAPYDRVIAFCSPTSVPPAWVTQARPGAVIVTTLTGALGGYGLLRLTVGDDGAAAGRVLPDSASFMPARSQANPAPIGLKDRMGVTHGVPRPARIDPNVLDDNAFRFTAQLVLPGVMRFTVAEDETTYTHLAHQHDGSWARLHQLGDEWLVEQGGARALWDELEVVYDAWTAAGSPPPSTYTIAITSDGPQRIWIDGTDLDYVLTERHD